MSKNYGSSYIARKNAQAAETSRQDAAQASLLGFGVVMLAIVVVGALAAIVTSTMGLW